MTDLAKGIGAVIAAPFIAIWRALAKISELDRRQVRSLSSIALLGGIIAFSAESIGILLVVLRAVEGVSALDEVTRAVIAIFAERMRYIAALQAFFAFGVIAVVLNADRISGGVNKDGINFKVGGGDGANGSPDQARTAQERDQP